MIRWISARVGACTVAFMGLVSPAFAAVDYDFTFTNLRTGAHTFDDFRLHLSFDDFVRTTGLQPIEGPSLRTPFGYDVSRAGTNKNSWWAFDGGGLGVLVDDQYTFGGISFLFSLDQDTTDYLAASGTFAGNVSGNALVGARRISMNGLATLTITDRNASAVPEPESWMLMLGGGALILALSRKRKAGTAAIAGSTSA
ncbi:PEP-CTERM sorting domain-containing protein [Roseateles chitinivorans]|uniref:PEP-CTERM sorting domain-containing protein n=1 Tax=Roseateles chitinivorans TaxID=2917965 RepID=UPI003D66D144